MLWVGLSGGIGSGKSTVSARLAQRGAVVVDADLVAREVVEPGRPALAEIADRFGPEVLTAVGELDRPALGQIVFGDESARRDLEGITHPRIAERTAELVSAAPPDAVVVHDIPLLVELDRAGDYALTVIVDVPAATRLDRLVRLRGMDEGQARARIAAQADDDQRRAAADVLLPNDGSVDELHARIDALWEHRLVPFEANLRHDRPAPGASDKPLVAHDPRWAGQASRLVARLRAALGPDALAVEHVGATAVPGQPAPDVLDLQVVVPGLQVLDDPGLLARLHRVGFTGPEPAAPTEEATTGQARPMRRLHGADPGRPSRVQVLEAGQG